MGTYYGPNKDDLTKLLELFKVIKEFNINNIVLTGDFNLVFNLLYDKEWGNPTTNFKCRDQLLIHMEEFNQLIYGGFRTPELENTSGVPTVSQGYFAGWTTF